MNKIDAYQEKYSITSTKEYIETAIRSSRVDHFAIIGEAHSLTLKEVANKRLHYLDKNWLPDTMNGNMIGLFRDHHPELMKIDKHKRAYMELANDLRIYFKKLNEDYMPSNIKTDHVEDLWSQNLGAGIGTKIHVLYMGYVLENRDWTAVKGVYASYPNNFYRKKIDWVIDMSGFSNSIRLPLTAEENTDELQIKPKINNQKTGEI